MYVQTQVYFRNMISVQCMEHFLSGIQTVELTLSSWQPGIGLSAYRLAAVGCASQISQMGLSLRLLGLLSSQRELLFSEKTQSCR